MWGEIISGGMGALGSIFGGAMSSAGQADANRQNVALAREQMAFQERMSNSAHQREMADLRKAGLNPILSAKLGGASSPAGAMPNIVNEMAPLENSARAMGDKLYNYNVQREQVNNMKLQNNLLKEQVKAAEISNARSGIFTPGFESLGGVIEKIVNKIDPWIQGGTAQSLSEGPDIVKEVIDAANSPTGVLPAIPTGYRLAKELSQYTRGSEAGKYYRGEKGFWESFKDAQRTAVKENEKRSAERDSERWRQKYELTPERLKAYGIKNLDDIRRRAGR